MRAFSKTEFCSSRLILSTSTLEDQSKYFLIEGMRVTPHAGEPATPTKPITSISEIVSYFICCVFRHPPHPEIHQEHEQRQRETTQMVHQGSSVYAMELKHIFLVNTSPRDPSRADRLNNAKFVVIQQLQNFRIDSRAESSPI